MVSNYASNGIKYTGEIIIIIIYDKLKIRYLLNLNKEQLNYNNETFKDQDIKKINGVPLYKQNLEKYKYFSNIRK